MSTIILTNILLVGSIIVFGKTKSVETSTDVTLSFHPIYVGLLIISSHNGTPKLFVNFIPTCAYSWSLLDGFKKCK